MKELIPEEDFSKCSREDLISLSKDLTFYQVKLRAAIKNKQEFDVSDYKGKYYRVFDGVYIKYIHVTDVNVTSSSLEGIDYIKLVGEMFYHIGHTTKFSTLGDIDINMSGKPDMHYLLQKAPATGLKEITKEEFLEAFDKVQKEDRKYLIELLDKNEN